MKILNVSSVSISTRCPIRKSNGSDRLQISSSSVVGANINVRSNQELRLSTNNTERVRITNGGLVGIGTTNPGGSQSALLHVVHSGACPFTIDGTSAGGGYLTIENNGLARYFIGSGAQLGGGTVSELALRSQTGGGITFLTNGANERARIDSSGRLLVGTSSSVDSALIQFAGAKTYTGEIPQNQLNINDTTAYAAGVGGAIGFSGKYHSAGFNTTFGSIEGIKENSTDGNYGGGLLFRTRANGGNNTERMRIKSNGDTGVFGTSDAFFIASSAAAGTGVNLILGKHSASSTFSGTTSFVVRTNGNVENTNNSYGAISDIKLKENIVNANSQWDNLKALQVRNYNFKEETNQETHTQIGLVAQEAELVSPGLVYESPDRDEDGNDLGTVTKSVNYSVLYMKAVKALQEAMERIEQLEQRLTDAGIA